MYKKILRIFTEIKNKNKLKLLALHEPLIDKKDKENIYCLNNNFISTAGPQTKIIRRN